MNTVPGVTVSVWTVEGPWYGACGGVTSFMGMGHNELGLDTVMTTSTSHVQMHISLFINCQKFNRICTFMPFSRCNLCCPWWQPDLQHILLVWGACRLRKSRLCSPQLATLMFSR